MPHLALLERLRQREHEAYIKLLAWMERGDETNFPFALVEWMQLYNALEMLRRKLGGGGATD